MPKKPAVDQKEDISFRDAMRGVKRIIHTKVELGAPLPKKPPVKKEVKEPIVDKFSDFESIPPVGSNTLLQFYRPGIQNKVLRNLRNGKYNVEAILDLHGKTVREARATLNEFLFECNKRGIRVALIIHGKGHSDMPVLKNKLNNWLRQTEQVLAFCSAIYRDGSTGALYLLLKSETHPVEREEFE